MRHTARLLRSLDLSSAQAIKANCRKVVCIGRNYAAHAAELSNPAPTAPFFFLKPPSSILCPNEGPIIRPKGIDLHHEVELGLVIGRTVKDLGGDDEVGAMGCIASYILAIDLTARNLQSHLKSHQLPWTTAKGFDTFCPISAPFPPSTFPSTLSPTHPGTTPSPQQAAAMLHDPYTAHLTLSVTTPAVVDSPGATPANPPVTVTRQSDSAGLMLFRIPRLLSEISKVMRLEEGDVVLTGTPKGVGPLRGGDRVGIGCLVEGRAVESASAEWMVQDARGGEGEGLFEFKE